MEPGGGGGVVQKYMNQLKPATVTGTVANTFTVTVVITATVTITVGIGIGTYDG